MIDCCSVWVSVSSFCQLNPRDDFNIPLAVQSLELRCGERTFQTKRNYHSNTSSIAATFQASTDLQTMGARLAKTWYGAPDPGWPLRARAHFRRKYREGVERRRSDYRPAMAQWIASEGVRHHWQACRFSGFRWARVPKAPLRGRPSQNEWQWCSRT